MENTKKIQNLLDMIGDTEVIPKGTHYPLGNMDYIHFKEDFSCREKRLTRLASFLIEMKEMIDRGDINYMVSNEGWEYVNNR